ncbi:ribonuclease H-like domain-containing protein [Tanacetum coccineum]
MWPECILTSTCLINRLPSSVLNGKSPYEMIYKKCHSLAHLRVFGCLCFATLVNSSDKFGSRSEKCVLIGYSSVKKGYRLYSLDKHQFIFSRDVKFFENIFPFKDPDKIKDATENVFQDSASSSSSESGGISVTADFPINSGNDTDSSDNIFSTQNEEVTTLEENVFSEDLPKGRKAIGSKWIYKIKFQSSGEIDRFKARLVAQGFSQKKSIDYEETFSPVVKMVIVKCLLNVVVSQFWPIFQLGVNNAFLYGDLDEDVYMKPPEGYFPSGNKVRKLKKNLYGLKQAPRQWNAKFTSTLIENGFSQSKSDYSLFTKTDKDLEKHKFFLGIEVVDIDKGICLNQRKYVLDLLSEHGMLACKPFMHSPLKSHLKTAFKILKYLKGCPGLGIHFVKTSVKSKTLSKSSTEAEYRALASVTSEVIWILKILKDLKIENLLPVNLHCDSNSVIKIAANPVFHERTKHFEIDLHFVREKILKGVVKTMKVDYANQIADVFTKGLGTLQHKGFLENLGMFDIYQVEMKGDVKIPLLTCVMSVLSQSYIIRSLLLTFDTLFLSITDQTKEPINCNNSKESMFTQNNMNMVESIQVASIIDKPLSTYRKDDLSLKDLGKHLLIEEQHRLENKTNDDTSKKSWWVDSGATQHVCNDQTMFKTYDSSYSMLYMGNHSTAQVKGKGKIDLVFTSGNTLTLNDVLHVLDVCKNLVSGSLLNKCGKFVGKGHHTGGMFKLNIKDVVNSSVNDVNMTEISDANDASAGIFWILGEALLTACCILNIVPSKRSIKTPYELWNQRTSKLDYFRIRGCRAIVQLPETKKRKLGDKGIEYIFLGYAQNSKAYRFIIVEPNDLISVNTIVESRDARFDENRFKTIPKAHEISNETVSIEIRITTKGNNDDSFLDHQKVEPRRSTRQRRQRTFGPDFEMYLVKGDRKEAVNDEMDSIIGNNTWILGDMTLCETQMDLGSQVGQSCVEIMWDGRVCLDVISPKGKEHCTVAKKCKDSSRSTSGYIFMLSGGPISWRSHEQELTTTSTMMAEYVACYHAASHAILLRNLVSGLKYPYVREKVEDNIIVMEYISTRDMLADPLTKILPPKLFLEHVAGMGLCDS